MDSFFASIEIRDKPELKDKPVAVGGKPNERGVLTTCNYIARKYGLHSAMPSKKAKEICKDLVIIPTDIDKYKKISTNIFKIFHCYTKIVEPISIDEAYLDVTESEYCNGDPELMSRQIRECIEHDFSITASAGISVNKLIAKICSDWKKPNNQFTIKDYQVDDFISGVDIKKIPGIGKVNYIKCKKLGIENCNDAQEISKDVLYNEFGSYGLKLYDLVRGNDDRLVQTTRIRKSISVEDTFLNDTRDIKVCIHKLKELYEKLKKRCKALKIQSTSAKEVFIKIKFSNFESITRQSQCKSVTINDYIKLFNTNYNTDMKPIRLLGIGFNISKNAKSDSQYDLFV